MKTKVIVAFLLCAVTASQAAFTAVRQKPAGNKLPLPETVPVTADHPDVLADLVAPITPAMPRGPRDLLREYESAMASIQGKLSADLGAILNAMGSGQITREQGEYISGERYQVAMMQFQLLSALHAMLEADLARTQDVQTAPAQSSDGDIVLVSTPFSSLRLSPSLVEYLGLTPTQVRSIQRLMDEERPTTAPLMHEVQAVSRELRAAIQQKQNNEDDEAEQRLAATQSRLLKQLMKANSRLQQRINGVLDSRQQKKFDCFMRTNEISVGEAN